MTDEELIKREQRMEEAIANAITSIANRMNETAVRLAVSTKQENSNSIMDRLLSALLGHYCTIILKNGKRWDTLILKAFDQNTLLCTGYFDTGAYDPVYRELGIARSEVTLITESVDASSVADTVRRYRERYDATA